MEPIGTQRGNVSTWMSLGRPDQASRHPARRAKTAGRKELSLAKRMRVLRSVPALAGGCLSSDSGDGRGDRGERLPASANLTGERDLAVLGVEALAALAPPTLRRGEEQVIGKLSIARLFAVPPRETRPSAQGETNGVVECVAPPTLRGRRWVRPWFRTLAPPFTAQPWALRPGRSRALPGHVVMRDPYRPPGGSLLCRPALSERSGLPSGPSPGSGNVEPPPLQFKRAP